MKPINLEFKGINSFSQKVKIDFEGLLADGLFGIFGKTGSGKSTILDCIIFALFGRMPRSRSIADNLNERSDEAFVDFTFEMLSAGQRRRYNVRRNIKTNKKKEVSTDAVLYEIRQDGVYPLEEKVKQVDEKICEIIGVGYDEFSKCIILPQNEFAAFVKATRTDRLKLVSKLFSLEKYDVYLNDALKKRKQEFNNLFIELNTKYNTYEKYTNEYLEGLKVAENAQKSMYAEVCERFSAIEKAIDDGRNFYDLTRRLADVDKTLSDLNCRQSEISELKEKAAKGALVSTVKTAADAYKEVNVKIKETTELREKILLRSQKNERELSMVNAELAKDRSARIMQLSELIGELNACEKTVLEIEKLRVDYLRFQKEVKELSDKKERLMREKGDLSVQIELLGSPDKLLDGIFDEINAGLIKREVADQMSYLGELNEGVKQYENSPLGEYVTHSVDERLRLLCDRIAAIPSESADETKLLEKMKEIRAANKKLAEIKERASACDVELAGIEGKIHSAQTSLQNAADGGYERKKILSALSEKVGCSVCSGAEFKAAKDMLMREKGGLQAEEDRLNDRRNALLKIAEDAAVELSKAEEKLNFLSMEAAERAKVLEASVTESGFSSLDEALTFALDEKTVSEYNIKVERFENEFANANAVKKDIESQLKDCDFDPEKYVKLKDEKLEVAALKEETYSQLVLTSSSIVEAEQKIQEAADIFKSRAEVSGKLGLCEKLEKVLANHKLLDFIAEEYLSEISVGASRTLLMLTSGRYDIIYDQEFFVLDNLNCGARRSVSTLSGGETFLVSLSLALSLSQTICEKTMHPVEFFFLDEGFGTLDSDLTDVVLDSLDKLRGEHFSIGVISHVPELRQRISAKVIVSGATATEGSKLEIVY